MIPLWSPEEDTEPVTGQETLFGTDDEFTIAGQEWVGMPEFIQEDLAPWRSLLVHFENQRDMEAFARLVEQTITGKTKSIWYPAAEIGHMVDKRYRDGS